VPRTARARPVYPVAQATGTAGGSAGP
jgi:hypothetical protein